jgi:hypothetical protein
MECKNCKKNIDDSSTFCRYCGESASIEPISVNNVCNKCGHENILTAQFCSRCGVSIVKSKKIWKTFLFVALFLFLFGMTLGLIAAKENINYKSFLPKLENIWEQP